MKRTLCTHKSLVARVLLRVGKIREVDEIEIARRSKVAKLKLLIIRRETSSYQNLGLISFPAE